MEGDETIESGALSFFSLLVDLFLVSLISGLYATRKANEDWTSDLREAHAILVATRLQGSVFSTHSLDRSIWDGYIVARGTSSREHTYSTVLAGLPMGTGAETFLLSTWAILVMRPWERRAEWSKEFVIWRCMEFIWAR